MRIPHLLAAGALVAVLATSAASEPIGRYGYVGPAVGFTIFDKDLRFPTTRPLSNHFCFGGVVGFQANRWLGIEAAGTYTPTAEDATSPRDVGYTQGSGDIVITPFTGRYGGPFLLLGAGAARLSTPNSAIRLNQLNAEVGAGVQLWANDKVGFRLEARDLMWLPKKDLTNPRAHEQIITVGVMWALGGQSRDTDADGVFDRMDKCPATPAGATVDATGCPHDSDEDGVLDGLDACPNTPKGATIDAKGCSHDTDGDGVDDGIDQCADTPKGATVDTKGCPQDADGDGVWDGIDTCPDTPKGATVDVKGCTVDSDGDGVPDGLDQCAGTSPGLRVDKNGCPIEVTERETELLDTGMIRLQNVNFETGKAVLLGESLPQLDIVGQVLSKWPTLRIEIGGHADSRGSNVYNQKLSESRVVSVLNYLLGKFPELKREQFTTVGYGEAKPLVPNTNPLNMAKNRRVEFKVLNTDVLKREVEHRKLLKSN